MKTVLVTRARPGAGRTIAALEKAGYAALDAATAEVKFLDASPDLSSAAALALTSPNGAAAASALKLGGHLPVYAVGDATAEAARKAGFASVASADGDGAALARLIAANPPGGPVAHLHGVRTGFDLVAALEGAGVAAFGAAVYDTVQTPAYGDEIISALPEALVLIHSPAGAERFAEKIAGRIDPGALRAAAISDAAASPLRAAGTRRIAVAREPNEPALFDALAALFGPAP
ncbi:MAG: uroporphyrinogen-III synthase [Oceanicaulis sp.]